MFDEPLVFEVNEMTKEQLEKEIVIYAFLTVLNFILFLIGIYVGLFKSQ